MIECLHAVAAGNVGIVNDVVGSPSGDSWRSYVSVKWNKGSTNDYRRGHQGAVDIKFTVAADGEPYYVEHLPKLGEKRMSFHGSELDSRAVCVFGNRTINEAGDTF